jgi:T5SS/PEP-CTERM-associated repeat protein
MRQKLWFVGRLLILIGLTAPFAQAQYTANFQTNIISGVTSNWSGAYYVGNTTFADVLAIQSSGVLWVSAPGCYLGLSPSSSNNYALVTDPGSVLSNVNGLFIGYVGSANSLVISNGGQVYTVVLSDSESGLGWGGGSYNTVVVTGPGSLWSGNHSVIRVGFQGGVGNSLVISDGGQVWDSSGDIGGSITASNNSVSVTGSGSVWSNSFGMDVGGFGPFSSLIITNNGQVFVPCGGATVGYASNSNSVRVADGGLWQVNALMVGIQGSSNSVVIAGGSVVATNLVVGFASSNCDNVVELNSGTLSVTNNGAGVLEVRQGTLIVNGGTLQADTLVITNPCAQLVHTGGALIVSNMVLGPNLFRITSITQQGNDLLVTWMMGPGMTNALQVASGAPDGSYSTNGFHDLVTVLNNTTLGTEATCFDFGAATNVPARYYRARLAP